MYGLFIDDWATVGVWEQCEGVVTSSDSRALQHRKVHPPTSHKDHFFEINFVYCLLTELPCRDIKDPLYSDAKGEDQRNKHGDSGGFVLSICEMCGFTGRSLCGTV